MDDLRASLPDLFAALGRIETKRMFGGHGVYADGVIFGLVDDAVLYLKTDADSVALFTARQLAPFEYVKDGKVQKTSYYTAPHEVLEDPEEATRWGRLALEAALRKAAGKTSPARGPRDGRRSRTGRRG